MNLSNIIFIDGYPKIDLHGCEYDVARVMVKDFIFDLIKMKKEIGVIIHGIGDGIVKKATIEELRKNKNVLAYKSLYNNLGCTIIHIKV